MVRNVAYIILLLSTTSAADSSIGTSQATESAGRLQGADKSLELTNPGGSRVNDTSKREGPYYPTPGTSGGGDPPKSGSAGDLPFDLPKGPKCCKPPTFKEMQQKQSRE